MRRGGLVSLRTLYYITLYSPTCCEFGNNGGDIAPPINWDVWDGVGLAIALPRPVLEIQPGWIFGGEFSVNCDGSNANKSIIH